MIYKSLTYKPITDIFNEKSCLIRDVEVPNISVSEITEVRIRNEHTPVNYINNNKNEIVNFKVEYIPLNNTNGTKLFAEAKKIIESVKGDNFTCEPGVIHIYSNGQALETININDCFPKTVHYKIEKNKNNDFSCIVIVFGLVGLLSREF